MRTIEFSAVLLAGVLIANASMAGQQGSCEINISGAMTLNNKSKTYTPAPNADYEAQYDAKRVHAFSDYWMTDAELRVQLESASRFTTKTPAELKQAVDKKMQKDPRLYIVAFGCGDRTLTFEMSPVSGTTYAMVAFKPGHYVIGVNNREKPGEFTPTLMLGNSPSGTTFHVTAPGTLDIERFDTTGFSGKFAFNAESFDKSKKIAVSGTFKYTCDGARCAK